MIYNDLSQSTPQNVNIELEAVDKLWTVNKALDSTFALEHQEQLHKLALNI